MTNTSEYTELKKIVELANELGIEARELAENIGEIDFEIDNYRFIQSEHIDKIQQEELSNDEYILGCFNDWFISSNCDIDIDVVQALQKAEAYEALGKLMLKNGIEDLQSEYASVDGYGHHFAHYDGEGIEIQIDGTWYYYFRTN